MICQGRLQLTFIALSIDVFLLVMTIARTFDVVGAREYGIWAIINAGVGLCPVAGFAIVLFVRHFSQDSASRPGFLDHVLTQKSGLSISIAFLVFSALLFGLLSGLLSKTELALAGELMLMSLIVVWLKHLASALLRLEAVVENCSGLYILASIVCFLTTWHLLPMLGVLALPCGQLSGLFVIGVVNASIRWRANDKDYVRSDFAILDSSDRPVGLDSKAHSGMLNVSIGPTEALVILCLGLLGDVSLIGFFALISRPIFHLRDLIVSQANRLALANDPIDTAWHRRRRRWFSRASIFASGIGAAAILQLLPSMPWLSFYLLGKLDIAFIQIGWLLVVSSLITIVSAPFQHLLRQFELQTWMRVNGWTAVLMGLLMITGHHQSGLVGSVLGMSLAFLLQSFCVTRWIRADVVLRTAGMSPLKPRPVFALLAFNAGMAAFIVYPEQSVTELQSIFFLALAMPINAVIVFSDRRSASALTHSWDSVFRRSFWQIWSI